MTAHSGRVGLASELTARGASTTEVMLAGNWKTARMVAHLLGGRDRRTRGRQKVFVAVSITNSHCKFVEVAHPLDAMNKESVRKQSIRAWLDWLRASALYQHEVPHGCR